MTENEFGAQYQPSRGVLSKHYSFLAWTMTENEFGAQYQPCRDGTFLDFYSDYHPDLYGDMAITLQPDTVETQK